MTRFRSKAAIALVISSMVISAIPAFANARTVPWLAPDSPGRFVMGEVHFDRILDRPLACSSSDSARPSQKKYSALAEVDDGGGVTRERCRRRRLPRAPRQTQSPSRGSWQVPNRNVFRGAESSGSKKSFQPIASKTSGRAA